MTTDSSLITPHASIPRIVSLIPSATEIVAGLGFEARLVGRSHECDYPPAVRRLPALTAPKFDPDGTSYEIDARVKAILSEGLAVYRVDAERLRALRPDVIVTQSQCDVCAAGLADVEAAVRDWVDARTRIVALEPRALADVWRDIERVAEALAVPEQGRALTAALQDRMAAISAAARADGARPTVACIEWLDPLMAAGNWMPELVELAGGSNCFGVAGEHSPWLEPDALVAADPDVIVVLPCGYDIARTRVELPALAAQPWWAALRAVRAGRVYLADGNQYFNRSGPRLVESLAILAEILHPATCAPRHEGDGWQRP